MFPLHWIAKMLHATSQHTRLINGVINLSSKIYSLATIYP